MTRDNFQRAIDFYAPIVKGMKAKGKLLDVTAVVVANLCVSYIMNERNHEAEELMRQVEREEELAAEANPAKRVSPKYLEKFMPSVVHTVCLSASGCINEAELQVRILECYCLQI
jgi:hypothetical protein